MATEIADVLTFRSDYTKETNANELKGKIITSRTMGSESVLYAHPHINTTFYIEMDGAAEAIRVAVEAYQQGATPGKHTQIELKMAAGVKIMDRYADQVEPIANDPANRATREEAYGNIQLSNLVPQKLEHSPKGNPIKPELVGKNIGTGEFLIDIHNKNLYDADTTVIICVEKPPVTDPPTPDPVITNAGGIVKVVQSFPGDVVIQTVNGKGVNTTFSAMKAAKDYIVRAFGKNGKKQIGELSTAITVKG